MESVVTALKDTPIPTILVIAGIAFLLLAIAGQVAGRISVAAERQRWAVLIGGRLLAIGLALHLVPLLQSQGTPPLPERVPTSGPITPQAKDPPPQPSGGLPPPPLAPESSVPSSSEGKEPNNDMTCATVITEGTTVRGSIGTDQDQDFFRVNPSGDTTRVILRVQSSGFISMVIVYDDHEQLLAMRPATVLEPATLSFESIPGSIYYIMVKSVAPGVRGKYELVVRKE